MTALQTLRAALDRHKVSYSCERCRLYASQLHVHHKTYVRLGKEHWSDLEVLCEYCHQEHHGHA